ERLIQTGSYDAVLLGLDGGDDVAHWAGPRSLDLGLHDVGVRGHCSFGEILIFARRPLAVGEAEAPAAPDTHRLSRSRLVGGPRHARTPIDPQRLAASLAGD